MRVGLQYGDPHVVRITSALHADRLRTVGALHAVWCVFDQYSTDGKIDYTPSSMDDFLGWSGFTQAMIDVGWLEFDGVNSLIMNNPESHNGKSAKRRASENLRKQYVRNMSAQRPHRGGQNAPQEGEGDLRSKSKASTQGGRVLKAPPSQFSQADFDQRDMRLIGAARKKLNAWMESHPSSSNGMTNAEFYGRIADETGLTIERILALEKLQHEWPESKRATGV
jgi:hypothetical protein